MVGPAARAREFAAACVRPVDATDVVDEVEKEFDEFGKGDDGHADPEAQLTADVRQQLSRHVILLLLRLKHVAIGDVDVQPSKVPHRYSTV